MVREGVAVSGSFGADGNPAIRFRDEKDAASRETRRVKESIN
jgi:hypothetical protein